LAVFDLAAWLARHITGQTSWWTWRTPDAVVVTMPSA
jgi:hypothetical protein